MQHEVNAYTEDPQEKFLKKLRKFNLTGDRATRRPGFMHIFPYVYVDNVQMIVNRPV